MRPSEAIKYSWDASPDFIGVSFRLIFGVDTILNFQLKNQDKFIIIHVSKKRMALKNLIIESFNLKVEES